MAVSRVSSKSEIHKHLAAAHRPAKGLGPGSPGRDAGSFPPNTPTAYPHPHEPPGAADTHRAWGGGTQPRHRTSAAYSRLEVWNASANRCSEIETHVWVSEGWGRHRP